MPYNYHKNEKAGTALSHPLWSFGLKPQTRTTANSGFTQRSSLSLVAWPSATRGPFPDIPLNHELLAMVLIRNSTY
jgi:hypothetical protein